MVGASVAIGVVAEMAVDPAPEHARRRAPAIVLVARRVARRHLRPAMHVHRDQAMRVRQTGRGDRQRRQQAAIDQFAAMQLERGEHAGDRERRPHRVPQVAAAQPDLALAQQVHRDRGEFDRQVLDARLADHLAQRPHQAVAGEQRRPAEARIEQPQHRPARGAQHPVAQVGQFAGRARTADQRPARRAGDRHDAHAARLQGLDHPDLRQPARAAGAEHQRHGLAGGDRRCACGRHQS